MAALIEIGLQNAPLALGLGGLVWILGRFWKQPALMHTLWVLVLLKLLVPPLIYLSLPWQMPAWCDFATKSLADPQFAGAKFADPHFAGPIFPLHSFRQTDVSHSQSFYLLNGFHSTPGLTNLDGGLTFASVGASLIVGLLSLAKSVFVLLMFLWGIGAVLWFCAEGWRVVRFAQVFIRNARLAPDSIQQQAATLAKGMGLKDCPPVWLLSAVVSPMLWCIGGRARILFPSRLVDQLDSGAVATLLTHELAHYHRRDHWVRMLEFVATGLFWWHPAVWLARREIEIHEEQCCDAWVVSQFPQSPRQYANALLATIDFLSEDHPAVPATASGLGEVPLIRERLILIMRGAAPKSLCFLSRIIVAVMVLLVVTQPRLMPRSIAQSTAQSIQTFPLEIRSNTSSPVNVPNHESSTTQPAVTQPAVTHSADAQSEANLSSSPDRLSGRTEDQRLGTPSIRSSATSNLDIPNITDTPRSTGRSRKLKDLAIIRPDGALGTTSLPQIVASVLPQSVFSNPGNGSFDGLRRTAIDRQNTDTNTSVKSSGNRSTNAKSANTKIVPSRLTLGDLEWQLKWMTRSVQSTQKFLGRIVVAFVSIEGSDDSLLQMLAQSVLDLSHFEMSAVATARDGQLYIAGCRDGLVRIWSSTTGELTRVLTGHRADVRALAVSPLGTWLATGDQAGEIRLWSLLDDSPSEILANYCAPICSLAFSRDGQTITVAAGGGAMTQLNILTRSIEATHDWGGDDSDGDVWSDSDELDYVDDPEELNGADETVLDIMQSNDPEYVEPEYTEAEFTALSLGQSDSTITTIDRNGRDISALDNEGVDGEETYDSVIDESTCR